MAAQLAAAAGMIDKHALAARVEHLFRLLVASGNAAVTDVLDAIPRSVLAALSLGRGIHELYDGPKCGLRCFRVSPEQQRDPCTV